MNNLKDEKIYEFSNRGFIKEITSFANPIIKKLKGLHLKKNRQEEKLFLTEGLKLIKDALELSWPIDFLIVNQEKKTDPLYEDLILTALNKGANIIFVSKKLLENLSKRDNPQNAMAVLKQRYLPFHSLIPKKGEVYLALDQIRDPGNLGTIIRTADAAGVNGIILIGNCTDLYALETVRATMGSLFAVNTYFTNEEDFISLKKDKRFFSIGTHLQATVDYRHIDYQLLLQKSPLCLLLGNEQKGLSSSLTEDADKLIFIPQIGTADSLNLSIASALVTFEAKRHLL